MNAATFVDLVETDGLPVTRAPGAYQADPGYCKEVGITEEQRRASHARDDRVAAGDASVEDICEKELDTFCYCNVADKNLVATGEVWSDGAWHYFQPDDFLAYLFQQHPDIKGKWTVRYQEKMLRQLGCHKATLSIDGSRGRPRTLHVVRTPWRGGITELEIAGSGFQFARETCRWSFDPAAAWNRGLSWAEIMHLDTARSLAGTVYLSADDQAEALLTPPEVLQERLDAKHSPRMLTFQPVVHNDDVKVIHTAKSGERSWLHDDHPLFLSDADLYAHTEEIRHRPDLPDGMRRRALEELESDDFIEARSKLAVVRGRQRALPAPEAPRALPAPRRKAARTPAQVKAAATARRRYWANKDRHAVADPTAGDIPV